MDKRDKVIKGLEWCMNEEHGCYQEKGCPYENEGEDIGCKYALHRDALALLKAQKEATIEPKRIELADETKAWLDKMNAVDALANIADICMDWDGYRTADGLGGLINEIWAYARYCADRIAKAQEPRVMTLEEVDALGDDAIVWLECLYPVDSKDIATLKPAIYQPDNSSPEEDGYYCVVSSWGKSGFYHKDSYLCDWRCWTARPDQATREAISWN